MRSALLVVEKPKPFTPQEKSLWEKLVREIGQIVDKNASIEMLGECCLLLGLEDGAGAFGEILFTSRHYTHRILFLIAEDDPEWIRSKSIPK